MKLRIAVRLTYEPPRWKRLLRWFGRLVGLKVSRPQADSPLYCQFELTSGEYTVPWMFNHVQLLTMGYAELDIPFRPNQIKCMNVYNLNKDFAVDARILMEEFPLV